MTSQFADYLAHGWKLCRIEPGSKGPRQGDWNEEKNAISPDVETAGAGLMHAYSGTCAIDIDRYDDAEKFLQENLIDLKVLFTAPDAVRVSSGRPNRGKLLYRLDVPLPSLVLADNALEFRCATRNGKTVQDVVPPTVHPDTGKPYEWAGDWRQLPTLPAPLKALWLELLGQEPRAAAQQEKIVSAQLFEIRDLLARRDSSCAYDEWLRIGMAVHHESGGSDEGFNLWDEWSASSDKYAGVADLRSHWVSFGRSATPITANSLRSTDVAGVDDFDMVEGAKSDWLGADKVESTKPKAPAFTFLSLTELFDRPEPSWLIPSALPDSGIGSFWGQPGGGKTFLAVDTALTVALGNTWRGQRVKQGAVLYIAAEDDSGVQARFASGLASRGVQDAPIKVLPAAPVFTDDKQTDALLKAIQAQGKQALTFIDTLAAVTPGSDENAGKDMSKVIHFCQKIQKVTGGLVLLVHHEGKTVGKGPRGWSGLHGAFDVEWCVTDEEDHREMRISKMKNAPTGNSHSFQLLPVGGSCIVEWI